MKITVAQRTNLASFIARAASVCVYGNVLTRCALLLFRDALEIPRRLRAADPGSEIPVEEHLHALAAWMNFAPHKLALVTRKSF